MLTVTVSGPRGSGKTTLIKLLGYLLSSRANVIPPRSMIKDHYKPFNEYEMLSGNLNRVDLIFEEVNTDLNSVPTSPVVMQYFQYEHLPDYLKEVSKHFGNLAVQLLNTLPDNDMRHDALKALLVAKDAAVRSKLNYK